MKEIINIFKKTDTYTMIMNAQSCAAKKIPIWFNKLKDILTDMCNKFNLESDSLSSDKLNKISWKIVQSEYSKRKIRDILLKEYSLKSLDIRVMTKQINNIFREKFGESTFFKNLGFEKAMKIMSNILWVSPKAIEQNRKLLIFPSLKEILFNELDVYIRFFPDYSCSSIADLSRKLAINEERISVYVNEILIDWIKDRFSLEPNSSSFNEKFLEIKFHNWPAMQSKKITFSFMKKFIEARNGTLKTNQIQWNNMEGYPSNYRIEVECKRNHHWNPSVLNLLKGRWCRQCHDYKCELIMGMFIDRIFGKSFIKQASLKSIFMLPNSYSKIITCDKNTSFKYKVQISKQTFDGYLELMIRGTDKNENLLEKLVKIAFEYDGIQHDKYNSDYHYGKMENFYIQRCRDIAKDEISLKNDIIVIKLKESKNFDLNNLNKFQAEIINQFQDKTGIKLEPMNRYYYDIVSNEIKTDPYNYIDIQFTSNVELYNDRQIKISHFLGNK